MSALFMQAISVHKWQAVLPAGLSVSDAVDLVKRATSCNVSAPDEERVGPYVLLTMRGNIHNLAMAQVDLGKRRVDKQQPPIFLRALPEQSSGDDQILVHCKPAPDLEYYQMMDAITKAFAKQNRLWEVDNYQPGWTCSLVVKVPIKKNEERVRTQIEDLGITLRDHSVEQETLLADDPIIHEPSPKRPEPLL